MTGRRHYPPIAVFHIPQRPVLGGNGTATSHDLARTDWPHHRDCACFKLAMMTLLRAAQRSEAVQRILDQAGRVR